MFKLPVFLLLCAMVFGAANGAAQVSSSAAAVTLVATVQESFTVFPTEIQLTGQQGEDQAPVARGVYALLGWRLRQAGNFRLQWELQKADAPAATNWHSELLTLREVAAQSARMSFVGSPSSEPILVAPGESAEDAPAGFGGVLLILPPQPDAEDAILRIKIVIL